MLKNLRRASVLVFPRRRTLNPKTLKPYCKPKILKILNPKPEHTAYTQYFLQFLFSCSAAGHPQCCSPGKPWGLCVFHVKLVELIGPKEGTSPQASKTTPHNKLCVGSGNGRSSSLAGVPPSVFFQHQKTFETLR